MSTIQQSTNTRRSAVIDFIKAHPVFTVFFLIVGIYAIVFILCLLKSAKDPYDN